MDSLPTNMNFLDVTVKRKGNKLRTDLFCKPANTYHYVHAHSCHQNESKISITYGQQSLHVKDCM